MAGLASARLSEAAVTDAALQLDPALILKRAGIDPDAWQAWLKAISGQTAPDLEIVNRTLRLRDQGLQARVSAATEVVQPKPREAIRAQVTAAAPKPTTMAVQAPAPAASPAVCGSSRCARAN